MKLSRALTPLLKGFINETQNFQFENFVRRIYPSPYFATQKHDKLFQSKIY